MFSNNVIVCDINQLIQTINQLQSENSSLLKRNNEQAEQIKILDTMIDQLNDNLNKLKNEKQPSKLKEALCIQEAVKLNEDYPLEEVKKRKKSSTSQLENLNIVNQQQPQQQPQHVILTTNPDFVIKTLTVECDELRRKCSQQEIELGQFKTNSEYLMKKYNECRLQDTEINKLRNTIANYEEKIRKLGAEVDQLGKENKKLTSTGRPRKQFFELCRTQRNSLRSTILEKFQLIVNYLSVYNLALEEVTIMHKPNAHATFDLHIKYDKEARISPNYVLYTKDKYQISDRVYINLNKNLAPELPHFHSIKKIRANLNKELLADIRENARGFYVDVKSRITRKIEEYVNEVKDRDLRRIKIKISADSTNVGLNIKLLNVAFSIVNDSHNCKSEYGHNLLGEDCFLVVLFEKLA
jgi:hypothetical protein